MFYDGSQKLFKYIIQLMRVFQKDNEESINYTPEKKYKLIISESADKEMLTELIKHMFFADYQELLDIIEIKYQYSSELDLPECPPIIFTETNDGGRDHPAYDNGNNYDNHHLAYGPYDY